jgi:hypothetical protein
MGIGNSKENKEDTINWNNLQTDNISSTRPNIKGMNKDVQRLVLNLNYPEISENSEFNSKYLLSNNINLKENNNLNISEIDNNSTSPFISSEMYKYIVDKYQNQESVNNKAPINNQMKGGAKNNYSDDSSTSSTSSSKLSSSSSSSSSETAEERKERKAKKEKKTIKGGRKTKKAGQNKKKKNSKFTEDELSYISSSAHTVSEKSVSDENSISVSSSIRTSQINLISE